MWLCRCIHEMSNKWIHGRVTINGAGDDAAARQKDERDKGVTFKN